MPGSGKRRGKGNQNQTQQSSSHNSNVSSASSPSAPAPTTTVASSAPQQKAVHTKKDHSQTVDVAAANKLVQDSDRTPLVSAAVSSDNQQQPSIEKRIGGGAPTSPVIVSALGPDINTTTTSNGPSSVSSVSHKEESTPLAGQPNSVDNSMAAAASSSPVSAGEGGRGARTISSSFDNMNPDAVQDFVPEKIQVQVPTKSGLNIAAPEFVPQRNLILSSSGVPTAVSTPPSVPLLQQAPLYPHVHTHPLVQPSQASHSPYISSAVFADIRAYQAPSPMYQQPSIRLGVHHPPFASYDQQHLSQQRPPAHHGFDNYGSATEVGVSAAAMMASRAVIKPEMVNIVLDDKPMMLQSSYVPSPGDARYVAAAGNAQPSPYMPQGLSSLDTSGSVVHTQQYKKSVQPSALPPSVVSPTVSVMSNDHHHSLRSGLVDSTALSKQQHPHTPGPAPGHDRNVAPKEKRSVGASGAGQQQSAAPTYSPHPSSTPVVSAAVSATRNEAPEPVATMTIDPVMSIDDTDEEEPEIDESTVPEAGNAVAVVSAPPSVSSTPATSQTTPSPVKENAKKLSPKSNKSDDKKSKSTNATSGESKRADGPGPANAGGGGKRSKHSAEKIKEVAEDAKQSQQSSVDVVGGDSKGKSGEEVDGSLVSTPAAVAEKNSVSKDVAPAKKITEPVSGATSTKTNALPNVNKPVTSGGQSMMDMCNFGNVIVQGAEDFKNKKKLQQQEKKVKKKEEVINGTASIDENSMDPNNRKYSREKLLSLKNTPASKIVPPEVKNYKALFSTSSGNYNINMDFSSGGGSSFKNMINIDHGYNYGSRTGGGSLSSSFHKDYPTQIIHSVSLKEDVKLKTVENAWKPSALKKDPNEKIVLEARSLLNKLSPENFDSILSKFIQLKFSQDNINKVIDLIFLKAVWEPKFAEVYARFVSEINNFFNKREGSGAAMPFNIKNLLVIKCRDEFDAIAVSDKDSKSKMKSLKNVPDLKEREELKLKYEEEERLGRKKSVGLVTFIGELFKLKLIMPTIVTACFIKLLEKNHDIESLECLAKLISATGKTVEEVIHDKKAKGKPNEAQLPEKIKVFISEWEFTIKSLREMVADSNRDKIPSRIRFMFLDVLDLKDRNWVPRMAENKPKTMAQIEKDLDHEAMARAIQMKDDDRHLGGSGGGGGMNNNNRFNKRPNHQSSQQQSQSMMGGSNTPNVAQNKLIKVNVDKLKTSDPEEFRLAPPPPDKSGVSWSSGAGRCSKGKVDSTPAFTSMKKGSSQQSQSQRFGGLKDALSPLTSYPSTQNSFSVLNNVSSSSADDVNSKYNKSKTPSKVKQTPSAVGGGQSSSAAQKDITIKPSTPADSSPETEKGPLLVYFDVEAFEKEVFNASSGNELTNDDIQMQYIECLPTGVFFQPGDMESSSSNIFPDEVDHLFGRASNLLDEPLISIAKIRRKLSEELNLTIKELKNVNKAFVLDVQQLVKSILWKVVTMPTVRKQLFQALLISVVDPDGHLGFVQVLKEFQYHALKEDLQDDFPKLALYLGEIFGYLIGFDMLTLDKFRRELLVKYVPQFSKDVFIGLVQILARVRGIDFVCATLGGVDTVQSVLSPLLYRKYSNSSQFDPNPAYEKFIKMNNLHFLVEKKEKLSESSCPYRIDLIPAPSKLTSSTIGPTRQDLPIDLIRLWLYLFTSSVTESSAPYSCPSPVVNYLNVHFGSPCTNHDVFFVLMQQICRESINISDDASPPPSDASIVNHKWNEARFTFLFDRLVADYVRTDPGTLLSCVIPCLNALIDVNLLLKLPQGLLLSQFVCVKNILLDEVEEKKRKQPLSSAVCLQRKQVNAMFLAFSEVPHNEPKDRTFVRILSTDVSKQEGFAKTMALVCLKLFYNEIKVEEEDSEESAEEDK